MDGQCQKCEKLLRSH